MTEERRSFRRNRRGRIQNPPPQGGTLRPRLDIFDPYAGTAVTMDAAAFAFGILGAPEIAAPAAIIGLAYGIFGFLDALFGGGDGGEGGGYWYIM